MLVTFAPDDLDPLGPMFARTPALAMGDSDATYASAELDCASAPVARAMSEVRKAKRMVAGQDSERE